MDIDRLLSRVPDYKRFLTVDELFDHARAVSEAHPDLARCETVGRSTKGDAIPMLIIGNGAQRVMVFACPHPNEPVGAMMVHFLAGELVADSALREGRTWYLLPCVDPDGTRLNEGWFRGPFNIRNYAKHYYRPRSEDQVEWTFPIEYKTFVWKNPTPETRSLMHAIEISRPDVMYSLHNAGFGGVYYYISAKLEAAYPTLHRVPTKRGLPMSLGEPEMPWAVEFHPAVFKVPRVTDSYDYFEKYAEGDPASYISGGASSFEFADRVSSPFCLVTEVPYFKSAKIGDTTQIKETRCEVVLQGVQRAKDILQTLDRLMKDTRADMSEGATFLNAVRAFVDSGLRALPSQERWAKEAPGMDGPATVAQQADALYVGSFYRMLLGAMLQRAFSAQLDVAPTAAVRRAHEELAAHLDRWATEIEANLQYEVVPIRDLVQVQYGALLAVLNALGEHAPAS
ncbi:MAG: M14 family zinc carboxypeptidase [Clostridia bacterium]